MLTNLKPKWSDATLNTSGMTAFDLRVLVKLDQVETKTPGGIIILPDAVEKEKHAMTKATVVSVGENAWEEAAERASRRGAEFTAPSPGDRVVIGKYAGARVTGADGEQYAMCNDEDIIARLAE